MQRFECFVTNRKKNTVQTQLNIKQAMDFIDEFIQEYKNNPCLWNPDSVHFKNRSKRQEAYLKLIDVAARHGEHYNVERTKQKINNLRCAFRHQFKKYAESKIKGEKDEPYCPKRRYFESLMFLRDELTKDKHNSSDSAKEGYCKDLIIENIATNETETNCSGEQAKQTEDNTRLPTSADCGRPAKNRVLVNSVKILKVDDERDVLTDADFSNFTPNNVETQVFDTENKEFLTKRNHHQHQHHNMSSSSNNNCRKRSSSLSSQHSNETENAKCLKVDFTSSDFEKLLALAHKGVQNNVDDHYSNFGKVIAYKLRNMETTQAIYAEKLISDVLFQGQMKLLTACRINQFLSIDDNYKEPTAKK